MGSESLGGRGHVRHCPGGRHNPLHEHLLDVAEVLETFCRHQLYAKSSKCEFGLQELGFLGHCLSNAGVLVHQRKVQSIIEWFVEG